MIKVNEKEIHIRMGKKRNFIKAVILSDDTLLLNMNYELKAEIPTLERLSEFEAENVTLK